MDANLRRFHLIICPLLFSGFGYK